MKECKGFECEYIIDAKNEWHKCSLHYDRLACEMRKCWQSCKVCRHACKNRKKYVNETGKIKEPGV